MAKAFILVSRDGWKCVVNKKYGFKQFGCRGITECHMGLEVENVRV